MDRVLLHDLPVLLIHLAAGGKGQGRHGTQEELHTLHSRRVKAGPGELSGPAALW